MSTRWAIKGCEWVLGTLEQMAEDCGDSGVLVEFREAGPYDLPDAADDVADMVRDWLLDCDRLCHDDGGPDLDAGAFADAIRESLHAALREHTDLGDAAWQPTGRTMTAGEARALLWHPDGTPKSQGVG